ncbi:MAG: MATE family efflux transporter [Gammaproteobacteria bacterium]|nr:MATE family efflux transporter [Gammaproteobacteria bacterium]
MTPRSALTEFRQLGVLATPIIVAQLSQMGMGVADAVMAGRVSATDLAGVTLGGNFFWPTMLLMSGIVMAVTPSVSQLNGAGRIGDAGAVVRQALWIALVGGLMLTLLLRNAEPAYRFFGVDEQAIPVAVGYLSAASLALVPLLSYTALRCLAEGMSWTTPAMCISLSALPLKILLNWLFMYGSPALGIAAMGGVGCGWSTAVVMSYTFLAMLLVVSTSRMRASNLFTAFSWPRLGAIRDLLVVGVPIGLALLVEVGFFSVAGLLIGRLGVEAVASHQIAFNVAGIAFMVPLALGMAATIRVGFNVGAGDRAAARLSAWVAVTTTLVWGICVATVMLTARFPIVGLYTNNAEVINVAAALLAIGALFQVFDSAQATTMGALRGYKETVAPMWIAVVAYWLVGLPVGAALCFGVGGIPTLNGLLSSAFGAPIGVYGLWWGLVVGLAVAAVALVAWLVRVSRSRPTILVPRNPSM